MASLDPRSLAIAGMINAMIKKEMDRGAARSDAIKLAMLGVADIMFDPKGRAKRNLARFLSGRGETMPVLWFELEKEDKNVRARVHGELVRRVLGIDTITETWLKGTPAEPDKSTITLFQHTYAVSDWMYALGSFDIKFEVLRPPSTPAPYIHARIWGTNVYRWYADENRVTKRIHEVCSELVKTGKSKPFDLVMKPTEITVELNADNLNNANTGFQTNPNSGAKLLTPEQKKRAYQKAADLGYSNILLQSFM